jgi:uncharacterized membrane protein
MATHVTPASPRSSPVSPLRRTPAPTHPALVQTQEERKAGLQTRIADGITRFAGSMFFVYVHIVWFALWIAVGIEKFPYGLLTMIVSLEAIFLSTFVMISQNRADERRQVLADHQWQTIQMEADQNEKLITLSQQILGLTQKIHDLTTELQSTRSST